MNGRRINVVFLTILVAVVAVLGGGLYLVHGIQIRRNASSLLDLARRALADKDLEKAEQSLSQYLSIRREDGPTWAWYARVVDERDANGPSRERAFLVHEQALRYLPGDSKLERRCADLALELERYNDAQRRLTNLLERVPSDSQGKLAAAELEDLLGQCDRGLNRFEEAEQWFLRALEHDPGRLSCYDRLARLRRTALPRTALRLTGEGDSTINEMVAKNPEAGRAYIYRWRYSREFLPSPDAGDLRRALKLAPDDPEVLFTAAVVSEQEHDAAAARAYLKKGCALDPKNLRFAVRLASLETREGHPDRAEEVLRRVDQVNPSLDLAFFLAETLIRQDKIEGKGHASDYIARLRSAGLGDTLVRQLEAEILVRQKKWADAIPAIEMARAVLRSDPQLAVRLNLMLAECYEHLGFDEQRLDALRQAVENNRGPESARIEYARALARSGKRDEAAAVLLPLAEHRPELRLDLVSLLLQKAIHEPRDAQNWPELERHLQAAEKALPEAVAVTLLRADVLIAREALEDARSLLTSAQAKDPRILPYRLALARLTQRQGKSAAALQILDQAEKDLGPSLEIQLARLDLWGLQGGDAAQVAVAKLAASRQQLPAADRSTFLDRLAVTEIRLRDLALARQYYRELTALQPDNLRVRLAMFDLAVEAGDQGAAALLVGEIRKIEGEAGTLWRFAQGALLVDRVRRGASHDLDEAAKLAAEISERQPDWWAGPRLKGEIADLAGSPDQAMESYIRAVELGNVEPAFARRLVGLLSQRNRFDDIDRVARLLRDRGEAVDEITMVKAFGALRKHDFDGALALARQVFSGASTNASDHLTLGRFYLAAGRTDDAGKAFRRAVELGPGVPDTWLTFVEYLVQTGRIVDARAAVEAARAALPADRSTLTLARCCLIVGEPGQAEALIQKALEDRPGEPAALRLAAGLYFSQSRLDKVNEYVSKLDQLESLSADDKAWVNRTRTALLVNTGRAADQDQALGLVEQNLKNDPSSIEDQQLKATVLALRPSRRGEAVKILEQLGRANPLDAKDRFLLAQLYLGQSNDGKYRSEMLELLSKKTRNPQHLAHFVTYLIDRDQLDQADRWLSELKKAEPQGLAALELAARLLDLGNRKSELLALLETRGRDVPDQVGRVADLLNRHGFAKQAEAAYKAFVAREPGQPKRSLVLADFLAKAGRHQDAAGILREAWKTCPHESVAMTGLSIYVSNSAGESLKREAVKWLIAAAGERPDLSVLTAKLAFISLHEGRFDEAELLNRRVLASDPENAEALNNLAWQLALRDHDKTSEALELINRAIALHGSNPSLLDTRAVALIRAGHGEQAIKDLGDAQARNPRSVVYALHLAWAYQSLGRIDEARASFRLAEELGLQADGTDPLERSFIVKLRRDLSGEEPSAHADRKT